MAVRIQTIEYHTAALARNAANQQRRVEQQLDVSDCGLSSWGADAMSGAHHEAIAALERGADLGVDGPVAERVVLCCGDRVVATKTHTAVFNGNQRTSWFLDAPIDGRRFIPMGEHSRVQKQLGLSERWAYFNAKPYLDSSCAGIGLPCHYWADPIEDGFVAFCDEEVTA